jgi:hypothetical protein
MRTKLLLFASLLAVPLAGCAQLAAGGSLAMGGTLGSGATVVTPVISSLSSSVDANTIVTDWSTQTPADSQTSCGTSPGVYTKAAVDNGVWSGQFAHQNVVAGLSPSVTYYCQVSSTNTAGSASATFTATTTALPGSTPITGLSLGSISSYNAIVSSNQGCADTYYNARSDDGVTYFTVDDTTPCGAWKQSGLPSGWTPASMSVAKFTSESPLAGISINNMTAYGPCCTQQPPDSADQKDIGLFAMNGLLFMTIGRESWGSEPYYPLTNGQIIESPDRGATWNNFQQPGTYLAAGNPSSPVDATMYGTCPGAGCFGAAAFVMYGGDDGTLGYTSALNRQDDANAYVYLISNEGVNFAGNTTGSDGAGSDLYLARIPRAKLAAFGPRVADVQYFTGGDGNLDGNWSATSSAATAMVTNYASISQPAVQFIPALDRYLLLTYSMIGGINSDGTHTQWLGYEAPHPWGPWSLISTMSFTSSSTVPGAYNPIPLNDTAWAGTSPTILFTGNFKTAGLSGPSFLYQMYFATLTINH